MTSAIALEKSARHRPSAVPVLLMLLCMVGASPAGAGESTVALNLRMDPALADRGEFGLVQADASMAAAVRMVPVLDTPLSERSEAQQALPESGPDSKVEPSLVLGIGDSVGMSVYGRPEMNLTSYIADDGSLTVPLAGAVKVAGLTPVQAGAKIAQALREGQYLLRPHVNLTLTQLRSQQVSVLGEVRTPGRFPIESRTTVFDVLALAGGTTENGADLVYVLRQDGKGEVMRHPVDLKSLNAGSGDAAKRNLLLRGGDSVFVPRAEQFYIYGEVHSPNMYRLEPGMTVVQALARGGGVTTRGSRSRIEISRRAPDSAADAPLQKIDARPSDVVLPNDVLRVKERIF